MLSALEATVHLGAHADAPCHFHPEGEDIAARDLRRYLGLCQVVHLPESVAKGRILPQELTSHRIVAPRVLFRTDSFPDPEIWIESFRSLSPELIIWLTSQGVVTVGIDTPSVDPHDSKGLETHQALYQHDVAVLEGLDLSMVPEGEYTLIALPLRLEGFDASPVRAVLLPPRIPLV